MNLSIVRAKMVFYKLKENGFFWSIRRVVRELTLPTTSLGKWLKPWFFFVHHLMSKPVNFLYTRTFRDTKEDSLYFFYDFEVEPITYDFVWALCIANARRDEMGLSGLKVVFVPGFEIGLRKESFEYEQAVSRDARSWRIYSILIPSIKLLSFPVSLTICATRNEAALIRENLARYVYPEKYNVTFPIPHSAEHGINYRQKFMTLQTDRQSLKYVSDWLSELSVSKKIITMTFRQYSHLPNRNTNMEDWLKFANELNKNEFFVVFIPDTESSMDKEPIEWGDFNVFYPACWNLNLRSALYELAYLNLGVNNGPMALCWLNPRCRYISFKTIIKDGPQAAIDVLVERGFVPGKNPLFANRFQKWVWDMDDLSIIRREFALMYASIERG